MYDDDHLSYQGTILINQKLLGALTPPLIV